MTSAGIDPAILPEPLRALRASLLAEDPQMPRDLAHLEKLARWRLYGSGLGSGPDDHSSFIGQMRGGQPWLFLAPDPHTGNLELIALPIDLDRLPDAWLRRMNTREIIAQAGAAMRIVFAGEEVEISLLPDATKFGARQEWFLANPVVNVPFSMKEIGDQEKVLLWYDGPLVFVAADHAGRGHLFYCYEDTSAGIWSYLGTPLDAGDLQALEAGSMAMIEPFRRSPWLWEAIWPGSGDQYLGRPVPSGGCPLIPPPGVTLYPSRDEAAPGPAHQAPEAK